MSGQTAIPKYRETVSEFLNLTIFHDQPTYDTLKLLTNQINANLRSVRTSLGGGQLGYLGLLFSPTQYTILSQVPFMRPAHPGPLIIPAFQLPQIVTQIQSQHHKQLRIFNECNNVDQSLYQQIVRAVDESYLMALRN